MAPAADLPRMSLAAELAELREQKLAGAITPEQYELRRNAKLDDVGRYVPSDRKLQPEVIEGTVTDIRRWRGGAVAILDSGLLLLAPQDAYAVKPGDRIVAAGMPMNQCLQVGVFVNETTGHDGLAKAAPLARRMLLTAAAAIAAVIFVPGVGLYHLMHHGGVWRAGWFDWALLAGTLLAGALLVPLALLLALIGGFLWFPTDALRRHIAERAPR